VRRAQENNHKTWGEIKAMSFADDLRASVASTFRSTWEKRDGRVVPEPENLTLGNDAIEFARATVLYTDLNGSTSMVDSESWDFSAEVYKTFLHCAAKIIRNEGGAITSYDGDRVMGIWVDGSQSTSAVRAALKINWAVKNIINPALKQQYPSKKFELKQITGIDTSSIRATRTGVRGGNDLVWVGRAANYAAKLTALNLTEDTLITNDVFRHLLDEAKFGGSEKKLMWKPYTWTQQNKLSIHGSAWSWTV